MRFCRLMISLRRSHAEVLARDEFHHDNSITWNKVDWESPYNFLSFILECPECPARCAVAASDSTAAGSTWDGSSSDAGIASGEGESSGAGGVPLSDPGAPPAATEQPARLLVAFNAGHESHPCHLPEGSQWCRLVDTQLAPPMDICERDGDAQPISGGSYLLAPYSCIVLKTYMDAVEAAQTGDLELEDVCAQELAAGLKQVATRSLRRELLTNAEAYEEAKCGEGVDLSSIIPWAGEDTVAAVRDLSAAPEPFALLEVCVSLD